jgi:hypothetical protein
MYRMDKLTTAGISYGASGGSALFWFELLDGYTPEQWAAIGVMGKLDVWPPDIS